jgi:hypothetical protein
MQRLAMKRRHRCARAPASVSRVADQRMTDRRQMDADLVRASGFERALDERRSTEALERRHVRSRRFAARHDGHRRSSKRMTADRRVDDRGAGDVAVHYRGVFALHCTRLQLPHEIGLRDCGFRHDDEAARVLVQAMNDSGAWKRCERGRMMKERVQQRPVAVPGAGVHDASRRFVEDENGIVFVNDRELDRLRCIGNRGGFCHRVDDDALAAGQSLLALGDSPVQRDATGVDPVLEPASRVLGNQSRKRLVEAQPRELGRDLQLAGNGGIIVAMRSSRSAIIRATHEGWHR